MFRYWYWFLSQMHEAFPAQIPKIFGFAVLAIFLIGFSVFVPKDFGFSVLVFIAVCGFFVI